MAATPGRDPRASAPARGGRALRVVARSREREARWRVELLERSVDVVAPRRQRGERRGRRVRRSREYARVRRREATAVEARRVTEDQRSLRRGERLNRGARDERLELLLGRVVAPERL